MTRGGESDEVAVYRIAVEKWGVDSHVKMLLEEMAELQVAILHWFRRKATWSDVLEEVVDVDIMLGQFRVILRVDPEAYARVKEGKLERLRGLLK